MVNGWGDHKESSLFLFIRCSNRATDFPLSHFRDPITIPNIFPFLPMINVVGMVRMPIITPTSPVESNRVINVNPFLLINFFIVSADSLKFTVTMTNFLSLSRLCNFCFDGISMRQSGHQVVQKFRNTMLPLKSESRIVLPFKFLREISMGTVRYG